MRCKADLQVTANEFYDLLEESVKVEMKKPKIKHLKAGMSYEKNLRSGGKNTRSVKVMIDVADYPKEFTSTITTLRGGSTKMSYLITENDEGISVTYLEDYQFKNFIDKLSYYFTAIFFKAKQKRRVKKMLYAMEEYIYNKSLKESENE
ncbi:MAG: DUF3284 domain-containing protein [Erysipelotrichaceae bacterium]